MADNKKVDDIVAMLDQFMGAEGGHVNLEMDNAAPDGVEKIETLSSMICNGKTACSVPTLHQGLDGNENED